MAYLNAMTADSAELNTFAATAAKYKTAHSIADTKTATGDDNNTATFEELVPGYYLVQPDKGSTSATRKTDAMLVNVPSDKAATLQLKSEYPSVSEYLSEKNSSVAVSTYDDSIRRMEQARMEELRAQAEAYNQRLAESNGFSKPALDEYNNPITPEDYWDILDVDGNGMMGYISIPRINVTIPVYHGTSEEVLQVAVGHMQNTSLPVGGENTHAVLSGHRGLPSKALFTDLDQVQVGDLFSLTVLNETLYYRVDQILTVLPNETDALAIEKGKDYVTLVTCTPYGVNSHRLLVRGTRIDYTPENGTAAAETEAELSAWMKIPMQYRHLLLGLAVLAGILLLRALVVWIRKKFR